MKLVYKPSNSISGKYPIEINEANVVGFSCKNNVLVISFKKSSASPIKLATITNWTWTGETQYIENFKEVMAFLNRILPQTLANQQQALF